MLKACNQKTFLEAGWEVPSINVVQMLFTFTHKKYFQEFCRVDFLPFTSSANSALLRRKLCAGARGHL